MIHPRNRVRALAQVQRRIENRLAGSLSQIAKITLTVTETDSSIVRPMHLMVADVSANQDPKDAAKNIIQAFDESDQSLLLLGNPGSGKTTMLLELAQNLHDKAIADDNAPIPAVIDLARWSSDSHVLPTGNNNSDTDEVAEPIASARLLGGPRRLISHRNTGGKLGLPTGQEYEFYRWVIEQLNHLYKIPANVTEEWLRTRKLILLLDGLDEVAPRDRDQCLESINKFQDLFNLPAMAVTSRREDYDKLRGRLTLQSAVQIQPLSRPQIVEYLEAAGQRLLGVLEALRRDSTLWELLDSPLMLNIVVLAYHDRSASHVIRGTSLGDRRKLLIAAYVEEVTSRRNAPLAKYRLSDTQRWLEQLAYSASVHRSKMPLRRSWVGWRMTWTSNAPESRVRYMFSAFFPWVVGLSCSLGVILPLGIRLGVVASLVAGILLLVIQCSYLVFTRPIKRKRVGRVHTYGQLRRNGILAGISIAVLEYLLFSLIPDYESTFNQPVHYMITFSPLVGLVALAAVSERFVEGVFIEALWWGAIIIGGGGSYLLYNWHPNFAVLTFLFAAAFISTLIISSLEIALYLIINQSDYFRPVGRVLDLRSIALPVMLSIIIFIFLTFNGQGKLDTSISVDIVGTLSGAIIGIFMAFLFVAIGGLIVSPYRIVLAGLDVLPFSLGSFLEYSVDRSLLYKEGSGYDFVHSIFLDYFREMYLSAERDWANTAYRAENVPDPVNMEDWSDGVRDGEDALPGGDDLAGPGPGSGDLDESGDGHRRRVGRRRRRW